MLLEPKSHNTSSVKKTPHIKEKESTVNYDVDISMESEKEKHKENKKTISHNLQTTQNNITLNMVHSRDESNSGNKLIGKKRLKGLDIFDMSFIEKQAESIGKPKSIFVLFKLKFINKQIIFSKNNFEIFLNNL